MSATKKKTINREKDKVAPLNPPKKNFGLGKRTKGIVENKKTTRDEPDVNLSNSLPQEEYEVEQIVGKQILSNVTFYQVKWKGFSIEETTWEPEGNLHNAPMKIRDYENSLLQKKKPHTKISIQKSIKAVSEPTKLLGKRSKEPSETQNVAILEKSRKNLKSKNQTVKKKEIINHAQNPEVDMNQDQEYNDEKICRMTKLAYHHDIGFFEEDKITSLAKKSLLASQEGKKKVEDDEKKENPTVQDETITNSSSLQDQSNIKVQYSRPAKEHQPTPYIVPPLRSDQQNAMEEGEFTNYTPSKTCKLHIKIHRNQDEYGSFLRGDTPIKVIGVRHSKEKFDLEVMVAWKSRDDGTQPINSKVSRIELLKKGFWMPLLHFYESKMKMENSPDFNPEFLAKF